MHLYLKSFERYTKSSLFFLAVATCNITAALAPLLILACFFVSDKFVYKQCAQTNTIFQVHYLNNLMVRFLFLFRLSFLAAAVAILTLQHHSYDFFPCQRLFLVDYSCFSGWIWIYEGDRFLIRFPSSTSYLRRRKEEEAKLYVHLSSFRSSLFSSFLVLIHEKSEAYTREMLCCTTTWWWRWWMYCTYFCHDEESQKEKLRKIYTPL